MTRIVDLTAQMLPEYREHVPASFGRFDRIVAPDIDNLVRPESKGRDLLMQLFDAPADHLPHGEGYASETITLSTHCGTHVDAPLHSGNTIEGRPARTMSDIDLSELYAPGMVLDVRPWVRPNEGIEIEALERAIQATGSQVTDGQAVLIRTGQEVYTNDQPEFYQYPGMTGDGTRFLTSLGATILCSDSLAWDRPTPVMVEAYQRTRDPRHIWDGHFAIQDKEAFIVQKVTNLGRLPLTGFMVGFFPINLPGTSAAPCRAVAFIDG